MPAADTQGAIIGTLLLFPETIEEIADAAPEEWFTGDYRKAYRYILSENGADVVSLSQGAGIAMEDINEWLSLEFSSHYLKTHIGNLEAEATQRKIAYLGNQLLKTATAEEATKLIERFSNSLCVRDKTEPVPINKGVSRLMKEMERRHALKGQILGMTYGIDALDEKTEGMHKGDLVIVAGPSSMGKTAFALGASESACAAGAKTLIFSCEMTIEQLLMRSVSAKSAIPLGRIRSARLRDYDWPRLTHACGEIASWPMMIDDPAGISLSELTRKVRRYHKQGLDLVVIDYLQIMKYDKGHEVRELDIITTELKNLAKELQVCIVLLSQLNRGSEKEKRKPSMSDLRGSGMIENNADVILFPWREAANCQLCQDGIVKDGHDPVSHQGKGEIIIGKQRQGERNISVQVAWLGERTRFVNLAGGE